MAMIRTIQSMALLALVAAGILFVPAKVSAHAAYDRSVPARNEVVPEPPTRVDVWFTQEVFKREGRNFVRVFDEQDVQVSEGDGVVDDDDRTHMYVELPPDLPAGRHIVQWMTTSDIDGDTDEGAFCFYVGVGPTAEQEAECAAFGDEEAETTPTAVVATATEAVGATATAAPADGAADEDDDGAPTAAIVGGAIAGVAVLLVVVGGVAVWLRRTLG